MPSTTWGKDQKTLHGIRRERHRMRSSGLKRTAALKPAPIIDKAGYDRAGCGPDAARLGCAGRVRKTDHVRTYGMSFTSVRAVGRATVRKSVYYADMDDQKDRDT